MYEVIKSLSRTIVRKNQTQLFIKIQNPMYINENVIERTFKAMIWVLGPCLDESILDHPHLLELAESYNEIAAIAADQCNSTFEQILFYRFISKND